MTSKFPVLMVNPRVAFRNIRAMCEKFDRLDIRLRPHFKTHQSLEVGRWCRSAGIQSITVSSVEMASRFLADGWEDVLIALPADPNKVAVINSWPGGRRIHLLVDHPVAVDRVSDLLERRVDMWIKIDTGARRCGLRPEQTVAVKALASRIRRNPRMNLRGLLTHAGHTYGAGSAGEVCRISRESLARMNELRRRTQDPGEPKWEISVGDTPACSICEDFPGVTEVRCGNFVFYDVMQYRLGSCRLEDVAVRLVCPVIGSYPDRNEVVIHGGKVHLSAESAPGEDGSPFFGLVARYRPEEPWSAPLPGVVVRALSQEHGIVDMGKHRAADILPGDLLAILPVHSCLTADLASGMIDLEGNPIDSRMGARERIS